MCGCALVWRQRTQPVIVRAWAQHFFPSGSAFDEIGVPLFYFFLDLERWLGVFFAVFYFDAPSADALS